MPTHRYSQYIPVLFLLLDVACLNMGFFGANFLKFDALMTTRSSYLFLQFGLTLIWMLTFFSASLHQINRESRLVDHINKVLTALVVNLAIVFAFWFAAKPFYYSRQHLFYTYLIFSSSIILWRGIWHYAIRFYRMKGYNLRNVVVVGYNEVSESIVKYFNNNPGFGYNFLGFFDDKIAAKKVVGRINEIKDFALQKKVDIIYAYLPGLQESQTRDLIDFAENNLIKIKIISQFSKLGLRNLSIQNYGTIPVVNISAIPLDNKINQIIKRAFDIIFSAIVIIALLSWAIPLIALLIKLESKGPVFFKQYRNGLNNQKFLIYKFRTMVVHDDNTVKQATKQDARITRIGAILRKTSIDELPQFLNVFLGNMSVVGPRPHAIKHNEEFSKRIDRFIQRHAVKPGITGLAQAKGFRGETTTFNDISGRVRLDRFYVKNWSIFLDFKIILLTIISILRGNENAY